MVVKKLCSLNETFFLVINHIFRNESKQVDTYTYLLLLHELDHELPKYLHLPTYLVDNFQDLNFRLHIKS